jgi:formylglycine-generating enzyme required for sulfatase activity
MLLQRAGSGTIPPPGFTTPPWSSLASSWDSAPQPATSTVRLGPATVSIGHDDFEADDADPEKALKVEDHEFGWDNEHPKRDVHVEEFRIEWRPVTNGQFYEFYKQHDKEGKLEFPASWVELDGEMKVCTN